MGAARDVGKGLVDGNTLDEGREIADHFDGGVAQPLVFLEMPADKGESWTEFARLPSRHAAANPKGPGFVRSCKHNSTTDGNGFATQRRVKQLLYGGIEGIQVRMKDGGCRCHPDRSPVTFRGGSLGEHNKNKDDECQPIAIPDRTIDWTVDLSAVTRSQLERAVRERIGLDHDDFLIRVAVVAFGRKGDVAVDAGVLLELVEIADDLFRFGADILHRFRDQVR